MANEIMSVNDLGRIAKAFAMSNLFGFKNETEAFALMCIAQANGLHPAKAAERYHIIQGRPAMKSEAMLASFQESGGAVKWIKRTDTECKLWLSHPKGGEIEVTWNLERAQKAGLGGKDNWKKFPAQMLAARCVSEGVRALFPACLGGMYTPEEVSDFSNAPAVETVSAEVVEDKPKHPQKQAAKPAKLQAPPDTASPYQKAMYGFAKANPDVYKNVLKSHNIETAAEVPEEYRDEFFKEMQAAITAAAQPKQPKSAPTAKEQNLLWPENETINGEESNG